MLMILVLWILRESLNRLSQYHLEVQLDFCTSGVSSPIQHSSDDRDPSMMQNVLSHPYFLLHWSHSELFLTFARFHAEDVLKFFFFLVHCCFRCRYLHCLRHRNKFVYQITMMQSIHYSLFLPIWSSWLWSAILTIRCPLVSSASRIHANFDLWSSFMLRVSPCLQLSSFTRHCSCGWDFQLFRAFLMISLNFINLEFNEINSCPAFGAFSSCGVPLAKFCFSFICRLRWQTSPDIWPQVIRPWCCLPFRSSTSGPQKSVWRFSFNKVDCVKPAHEADKSLDPSVFQ